MAPEPFVRAISLEGFQAFATLQGLNPATMLERAALPPASLQREDNIIPYHRYCALLEMCSAQSGNTSFGLEFGLYQANKVFGDLLVLMRNTGTVGEALAELRTHYAFYNGGASIELDIDGGEAALSYHLGQRSTTGVSQAEELACGAGTQLMRILIGPHWSPTAVLLRHTPSANAEVYLQLLGCVPTFNAHCMTLIFDAHVLAQSFNSSDKALHTLVARKIGKLERLSSTELSNHVTQLLGHLLPEGRATVEKVASAMALSPQELRHRLAQERISFPALLEETRQTMALAHLADASTNIAELARLLGYSDSSGFSRAFHRWFDISPLNWQKQNGIKRQPRLLLQRRKRI